MSSSANPFESGSRKVIPAVLVYVQSGSLTLMIHRVSAGNVKDQKDSDEHAGKWNGLGGKFELDESALECAQREVFEESGLKIPLSRFKALGTLHFPNFKAKKNEDWMVFVFTAELESTDVPPQVHSRIAEGELHWISTEKITSLNLWPGDRYFLPWVIEKKCFVGTFWYRDQILERHWIQELGNTERSKSRSSE